MSITNISLVIITKNESENLERCLNSVKGIVSEMVLVDTGSDDDTVELARSLGANVFEYENNEGVIDLSAARNFGLDHATGEWILQLDADEELARGADEVIRTMDPAVNTKGFYLLIADTESLEDRGIVRLFRRDNEIRYVGKFHEQIRHGKYEDDPAMSLLEWSHLKIIHHGYSAQSVERKNKLQRNISALRAILENDPADFRTIFHLGNEYANAADYVAAISEYQKLIKEISSPEHPIAVRNLALAQAASGNLDEAITSLKRGAAEHPDYAELIFLQGLLEIKAGRPRLAFALLRQRMSMSEGARHLPNTPEAGGMLSAILIAICLDMAGDPMGAGRLFSSISTKLKAKNQDLETTTGELKQAIKGPYDYYQRYLTTHLGRQLADVYMERISNSGLPGAKGEIL